MTTRQNRHHSSKAIGVLLCGVLLAPGIFADEAAIRGEVNVGAGYISDNAFKFGEYNGLHRQGAYGVLDFSLRGGDSRWSDSDYWSLSGRDLGLDSRSLNLEWGRRFSAEYSEITRRISGGGGTIFVEKDTDDLRLPAGWVAAGNTAGMPPFALNDFDESIKRRRLKLHYQLPDFSDWQVDIRFRHEIRDGNRVRYGVIGNTGGNPRSVALPSPIDFTENALALSASRAGEAYALEFGYRLSLFQNDNRSQSWDNPYSAIGGWDPAAGHPSGRGAIALEPDNRYQQLFASGYYRLLPRASLHGNASYARMEQDESFLPYTVNPALSVGTPLPRNSLDGEIDILRLRLGYQHSLSRRLSLRVNTSYEDRDNDTPRDLYIYIGGDSQNQAGADSARARFNRPYSYTRSDADIALRYRLDGGAQLSARQAFKRTDRDFSEVSRMDEQVTELALSRRQSALLQWQLRYSLERRDPSAYRGARPYFESHTQAYIAGQPADERFENHPLLRKYYQADRERSKATAGLTLTPAGNVQLGLSYHGTHDDYDRSELGLQRARSQGFNLDLSVVEEDRYAWNSFFSVERFESKQAGQSFRGFAVVTESQDPTRAWQHDSEDTVKTLGSDLTVYRVARNTDMTLGYLLSHAVSELETRAGSLLATGPIPEQGDKMIRLSAEFTYHATTSMDVLLKLAHETYEATNFRYDNVDVDTMANVIALGRGTPGYSINWFVASFRYRF